MSVTPPLPAAPITTVTAGAADLAPDTVAPRQAVQPAAAAPHARVCWRTVMLGYALVIAGFAVIPMVPRLKSPAVAHVVLILCMIALVAGTAAVIWGFVRDVLRRRR